MHKVAFNIIKSNNSKTINPIKKDNMKTQDNKIRFHSSQNKEACSKALPLK